LHISLCTFAGAKKTTIYCLSKAQLMQLQFPQKGHHFHTTKFAKPTCNRGDQEYLQINGREIFQKERVDKGYRENR